QDIRESVAALSECLSRTARKPRLRAASRSLVRAKPPDRRLRRNVCRLATTQGALAARISKLAGARKARVRRLADGGDSRQAPARRQSLLCRADQREHADAWRALPAQACALSPGYAGRV